MAPHKRYMVFFYIFLHVIGIECLPLRGDGGTGAPLGGLENCGSKGENESFSVVLVR